MAQGGYLQSIARRAVQDAPALLRPRRALRMPAVAAPDEAAGPARWAPEEPAAPAEHHPAAAAVNHPAPAGVAESPAEVAEPLSRPEATGASPATQPIAPRRYVSPRRSTPLAPDPLAVALAAAVRWTSSEETGAAGPDRDRATAAAGREPPAGEVAGATSETAARFVAAAAGATGARAATVEIGGRGVQAQTPATRAAGSQTAGHDHGAQAATLSPAPARPRGTGRHDEGPDPGEPPATAARVTETGRTRPAGALAAPSRGTPSLERPTEERRPTAPRALAPPSMVPPPPVLPPAAAARRADTIAAALARSAPAPEPERITGVHIGAVDIQIISPAPPPPPASRPAPAPRGPLARGLTSPFGLRQG